MGRGRAYLGLLAAGFLTALGHAYAQDGAVAASKPPVLEVSPSVRQGQIIVVRLRYGGTLANMRARLFRYVQGGSPKTLWSAQGAPRRMESGESAMLAFLGAPLSLGTGACVLSVSVDADGSPFAAETSLSILKRDIPTMDIKLNPELTGIKASPDPRKDEESRVLTSLLLSTRADADFVYGPFIRPLAEKAVTSTFGDSRRYLYATGGSSTSIHAGLDLFQDFGAPVAASGRGRVVMAQDRIVTGGTVVIEHGPGLYGLYYHMRKIYVSVGDIVEAGVVLGEVGATGLATGPHLHWELRLGAEPMDPECLVDSPLLKGFAPPE